jgi:hypothetical protein
MAAFFPAQVEYWRHRFNILGVSQFAQPFLVTSDDLGELRLLRGPSTSTMGLLLAGCASTTATSSPKAISESPSHFGLRGCFWISDFRISDQETGTPIDWFRFMRFS